MELALLQLKPMEHFGLGAETILVNWDWVTPQLGLAPFKLGH